MKKITSAILALVLVISCLVLASCKKETPETLVNDVMAKLATYDSYDAIIDTKIKMEMMGMTFEMPMTMNFAVIDATSETPTSYMEVEVSTFGVTTTTEVYSDGGEWAYVVTMGEGYKVSVEEAKESLEGATTSNDLVFQFPAELFESTEIIENEDGTKTVELIIEPDTFRVLFDSMVESMFESLSGSLGESAGSISLGDTKVKVTTRDGDLVDYEISFQMNGSIEGLDFTASIVMNLTYIAFGDDVVITPPEGYLDFTELA